MCAVSEQWWEPQEQVSDQAIRPTSRSSVSARPAGTSGLLRGAAAAAACCARAMCAATASKKTCCAVARSL